MEENILQDWSFLWSYFSAQPLKEYKLAEPDLSVLVEYITCYSENNFYLFLRTDQKKLVCRDRAYQNGDGFHFVLTIPKEDDQPADEFYVIGISPLAENQQKKFVWYQNIDLSFIPLQGTKVDHMKKNNWMYFLVQIPWEEIAPFKPFLYDQCGINLSYAQAVPSGVNIYMLKNDPFIQSEQSKRDYVIHIFEEPNPPKITEWGIALSSLHHHSGQNLVLNLGVNGSAENTNSEINVQVGKDNILNQSLELKAGLTRWKIPLDLGGFSVGKYFLKTEIQSDQRMITKNFPLIVFDFIELEKNKEAIEDLKIEEIPDKKIEESISTLELEYQLIKEAITRLKPYQSFSKIELMLEKLTTNISKVNARENLFFQKTRLRMGIRSRLDNSLQPYSIYIPESISGETEVSLMVFLHGSGSDDRNVIQKQQIRLAEENKMIIVAPFGRGTSHYYSSRESLDDIIEVTQKVIDIFPIDKQKVFLGGFSMGGYGTLRLYDYQPTLFRGLIIISGHYYLKGSGSNQENQDYSKPEKIAIFKHVPMIFFHGKRDHNLSYQENALFFEKIKKVNPHVKIYVNKELGHSGLTENWRQILQRWLKEVVS